MPLMNGNLGLKDISLCFCFLHLNCTIILPGSGTIILPGGDVCSKCFAPVPPVSYHTALQGRV